MRKKVRKEHLKTLELGENATRDDIDNAYGYFVKLYSSDHSPELHPLREEFSIVERNRILAEIDTAYKALVGEDAVVRMEFAAETAPQEIHLDEEPESEFDAGNKEEQPEEIVDENEPVVEFVDPIEPMVDTPEEETYKEVPEELPDEAPADEAPADEEPAAEEPIDELDEHFEQIIELPGEDDEEAEVDEPGKPVEIAVTEDPVIEIPEQLTDGVLVEEIVEVTGKYLKKAREKKGLKVKEMAETINISYKDLSHIENEKFEKLQDPGYLRWVIKSYAKFLGLDEIKSTEDYMRRYRQKK